MKKNMIYFLVILLCATGTVLKFSTSHEQMPIGCDEFGYLNLAKAIDEHRVFSDHTQRPWLSGLLDTLRRSGITENEISYMVAPHAYHLIPETSKIINQYPPGTSAFLSIFSFDTRKQLFPFLGVLVLMLIPFFVIRGESQNRITLFHVLFPFFVFIMLVVPPFTKEFARINSLVFTFGFLLAAGMLIKKNPYTACFLIAMTVNFRVVNAFMLLPCIFFLPFSNPFNPQAIAGNFKIVVRFGLLILMAMLPLFFYNYLLLHTPFATTYSVIDTAFTSGNLTFDNIRFYFDLTQGWLIFHLILITFITLLLIRHKLRWMEWMKWMAFPLLNYVFFIFHAVRIDYYPYASSMILSGCLFVWLSEYGLEGKSRKVGIFLMIGFGVFIFTSGLMRYLKREHQSFAQAQEKYASLCSYQIVWADLFSGTSEYVCGNSGFRYGTTSPRARILAIQYLKSQGYTQAILINDNTVKEKIILQELQQATIQFSIESNPGIGKIIRIH